MRPLPLAALVSSAVLLIGCGGYAGDKPPAPFESPSGGAFGTPSATVVLTPTPTPTPTLTATPTKSPSPHFACPAIGFGYLLHVDVPVGIRAELVRVRIVLTQGKRHKDVNFPAQPFSKTEPRTFPGIVTKAGYAITLDGTEFDRIPWMPGKPVTLVIEGIVDNSGGVGYRHRETVRFRARPQRECDDRPYLRPFRTELSVADAV